MLNPDNAAAAPLIPGATLPRHQRRDGDNRGALRGTRQSGRTGAKSPVCPLEHAATDIAGAAGLVPQAALGPAAVLAPGPGHGTGAALAPGTVVTPRAGRGTSPLPQPAESGHGLYGGVDATGAPAIAVDFGPVGALGRRRARARILLATAVLTVAGALVATQFREDVFGTLGAVPAPRWHWLGVCLLASAAFYVANGVGVRAASGLRMSLATATASQLAAAAANRVVPAGLGAIAVHLRFLERRGMTRPAAIAAVASIKGASFLVHLAGIALVAGTLRGSGVGEAITAPVRMTVDGIGAGPCVAGLAVVGVGVGSAVAHPRVRTRLQPALRGFRGHISVLTHSPARSILLVGGVAGTKAAQITALAAAVWAFGGGLTIASIAAVYLVGAAVAGAAPTAGNVGAIEPALAIGLTASGGAAASMLAAVLMFRLISYWLPIIPGVIALAGLRRRGDL